MTEETHNKPTDSTEKVESSPPIRIWRKWLLWTFSFFFILIISAILFISYNRWIQQKIVKSFSDNIENVDFKVKEIEFNFWTNTLHFREIEIDFLDKKGKGNNQLIAISIHGIDWYDWLIYDIISIHSINLQNDVLDYEFTDLLKKDKKDNFKTIHSKTPIYIEKLNFSTNAIHFQKDTLHHFIEKNTFSIQNIVIDSTIFKMDWNSFSLNLENYVLTNHQKDTIFYAKNLDFTKQDSSLIIQDIGFLKNKEKNVFIQKITLQNIQINHFLATQKLYLSKFEIDEAILNLHHFKNPSSTKLADFQLQKEIPSLLKPFCDELKIDFFAINKADINYQNKTGNKKINNITFTLKNIYIHQNSYLDTKKILFSDSVGVSFEDFISNNQHYSLSFLLGNIHVNSHDTILYFYDFHYKKNQQLEMFVPQFSIKNINWRALWLEKMIDIDALLFQSPEIHFIANNENRLRNTPKSLNEMIGEIGKGIKIRNIQFRNAQISYKNQNKTRPLQQATMERLNFSFQNIEILANSPSKINIHNLLKNIISLDARKIDIALKNKTHLQIGKIELSSTLNDLLLTDFCFEKDSTLKAFSHLLQIKSINWNKYWNSNHFELDKIILQTPSITLTNNLERRKEKEEVTNWKELLPKLVNSFAKSFKINQISLEKATISYQISKNNEKINSQKLGELNVYFSKINIPNKIIDTIDYQPLYCKDIRLKGKKYIFHTEDKTVKLDSFSISTASKNIALHHIQVNQPNFELCLPIFEISEVDWSKYWNRNHLFINSILLDTPQISWKKTKSSEKINFKTQDFEELRKNVASLLAPVFDDIQINEFLLKHGNFTIEEGKNRFYSPNVKIEINQINLDTTKKLVDNYEFVIENFHSVNEEKEENIIKLHYTSVDSSLNIYGLSHQSFHRKNKISSYKIRVKEIHVTDLINHQKFYAQNLEIFSPKIVVNATENHAQNPKFQWKDFHQKIGFSSIEIKNISTDITTKDSSFYHISSGNIQLKKVELDSTWTFGSSFDDIQIHLYNTISNHPKKLYQTELGHLHIDYQDSIFEAQDVRFFPTVSDAVFFETIEKKESIYKIFIPKMFTHNLNYYELFHNNKIEIHSLSLKDANLEIFNDKRILKDADYVAPIPNDLVKQQLVKFHIDSIFTHNATILYKEKVINSDSVGVISFHDTDLLFANFHNDTGFGHYPFIVKGQSLLMNDGLLRVNLEFDLFSDKLQCHYMGTLENMNVINLNEILSPNSVIALKSGNIKHLKVEGIMFDTENKGTMLAKYRDIRIELYQKKAGQEERKVLSAIGNMILNNNQNQRKRSKIYYQKNEQDSFIKFLWLGIRKGLENTLLPMGQKEK